MKIGRWIILGLIVVGAASFKNDRGRIAYSEDCRKEWVNVEVYVENTIELPKSLRSVDGCSYDKVYYARGDAKFSWMALEQEERKFFKIKGRYQDGALTVSKIYHDDISHQKKVILYISSDRLVGNCVSGLWEMYCFPTDEDSTRVGPGLTKIEATINTANEIMTYKILETL